MSLLLEALKRAERAKKQQNIEEITAALEDTGSTAPQPSAPTALPTSAPLSTAELPAETLPKIDVTLASESFPTLLDEPEPTLPPLTTLGDDVSPTGHSNTLEFKLEPFDLPPVESPPAAMAEAPIAPDDLPNLDWSAVELSPAAAPTAPTSSIDEPAPLHIDITDSLDAPSPAIASASAANQPSPGSDTPAPTPAPAPALVTERLEPSLDASPTTPMVEEAQPAPVVIETPAPASPAPAVPPLAAPASPPPTSQRSKLEEAREKARLLLGKPAPATPEATPARKLTSRQQRLLILGAISTLSGTGIGLYFWNELNGGSGMAPMTAPALATNSATQTVEATNDGSAPLPPPVALPAEPPPAVTAAPLAAPALPASQATAPSSSETSTVVTGKSRAETAPVLTPAPQQPAPGTGSINIIRNPPRADVLDDAVKQGYGAYEQGNLPLARNAYQRALRNDPRNRQAMLGLAAIEEASGNIQGAATLYAQTLALDPKDTVAQAALVNLTAGNPQQAETKIRLLLAEQPNIAFLHFTLGNLLAAQQHWPEAETAYFQAVTLDGNNPDFAFNLAISLDQLRQAKPAREYYQRALTLSERRPYRFNRQVVQQRLEQLATP